jgi:hypothetical protein
MTSMFSSSSGRYLEQAMTERPSLTLQFYSYGILLEKQTEQGITAYPVDPEQVAQALAARVTFDTGLISSDTLLIRSAGVQQIVVGYRKPQWTGLYLDGSDAALRVPLPGLILIRELSGAQPHYSLYAVKQRPTSLQAALFKAPLPNIFDQGRICWGTVPLVPEAAWKTSDLHDDWKVLLGTRFNDHGCGGKSRAFPQDIRQHLIALEAANKRTYPKRDLIDTGKTLEDILKGRAA